MHWLLLTALLASAPEPREFELSPPAALEELRGEVRTGTLLVSEGDCLAIKVFTASPYTHVSAVVMRNDQPVVYDSAQGAGVRCQSLANYLRSQCPAELYVFHPNQDWTVEQRAQFEAYLDAQLGRPYSVSHHLTGDPADGLHCAEYVVSGLAQANVLRVRQPARVSPASLVEGIVATDLYTYTTHYKLQPSPAPPAEGSWARRAWLTTWDCSAACMLKLRGWVCCY